MRRLTRVLVGVTACCAPTLAGSLAAQPGAATPGVPTSGRVTLTRIGPENLCAQEQQAGERVARVPEGFALLRMRSELDAVARLESVRPTARTASGRASAERLQRVRREVDSLASRLEDLLTATTIAGGARGPMASTAEVSARRALAVRVRQLVPAVDDVVETALVRVAGAPVAAPRGYLGVTMSSVPLRTSLQSGYIVSYCDYPVVESVAPGSPAERAGLTAGDTIVAFNGRDVRAGMVDYTTLLEPARRLRIRARRDGRLREHTLIVGTRPEPGPVRVYARTLTGEVTRATDVAVAPLTAAGASAELAGFTTVDVDAPPRLTSDNLLFESLRRILPEVPAGDSASVFVFRRDAFPGVMTANVSTAPAAPREPVMITIFTGDDDAMVGGAQLKTLGAELRAALSLPDGVLVLQVLPGTPAAVSGLREGDVIREAQGAVVRSVRDVRVALEASRAARALALRVARRDAAERTVTMKW